MISNAMIKFRSKFQFQIFLKFCRISEKVIGIKLVMVMVKKFEKYHLHILVPILFFHD